MRHWMNSLRSAANQYESGLWTKSTLNIYISTSYNARLVEQSPNLQH